jgi:phage anti-repressor protein
MTGLVKKKGAETTTFLSEIVDEMGFVQTIDWIRSLSTDYNNFEDYVRKNSPGLFGMKK